MKRIWLAVLAIGGAGLAVGWFFRTDSPALKFASGQETESKPSLRPDGKVKAGARLDGLDGTTGVEAVPHPVPSPAPEILPVAALSKDDPAMPTSAVVEGARAIVTQYNSMFGENPVGVNEEIVNALRGDNPKQIDFLGSETNRINTQGQWVDPWGTPYFFHQLSARQMEVRSAGPDRVMWTSDDLVAR
jgi:hypothetical protein